MIDVIINADDFGINEVVTQETMALIENKIISSTTIMANGLCLKEVSAFAQLHPEISFGIHICLDEFSSITKNPILEKYGIIEKDGTFIKGAIFGVQKFSHELLRAVEMEMRAQIELIQSYGITISHADSHHLVHTRIKELIPIFIKVFDSYGIKRVRIGETYNITEMLLRKRRKSECTNNATPHEDKKEDNKTGLTKIYKIISFFRTILFQKYCNRIYKRHYITTDSFYYYSGFLNILKKNKGRFGDNMVVELMCHPGHPSLLYQEEVRMIKSKALLSEIDYSLINYNELA